MINAILIPTDFSEIALNALNYGVSFAKKCNAQVHIFHAKQIPVADPAFPAEAYQLYVDELAKTEKEGFADLEQKILKPSGLRYSFHSTTGFVADEIHHYAEASNIDLIVMGTKGASGIAEMLIGTNTAALIGKSHLPVMVIPPTSTYKELTSILYATDYNEPEFPAFSRLMFITELYDAKLTIMHNKTDYDRYFNLEGNFFNRNRANFSYKNLEIVNQEKKDVMASIDQWLEEHATDLVVMAKHNRGFFDRLFHRSLSKRMAYHTKIPLLVLNK